MLKVTYNLTINNWSINSDADPRTEFIDLETSHSLASPNDVCLISVYAPPAPQPGLLDQAVGEEGSVSVQVRGNDIKTGDPILIQLTADDVSEKVMTAEVWSFHSLLGQTKITGRTGMQKLASTRINQVYENQSLSQIITDLAGQAGLSIGSVDTGSTYPYFVLYESKNLWQYCRELAIRDGLDFYFDTDNQLTMTTFNKTGADHTFFYGIGILDLQLFNHQMPGDLVRVYGESPSSNQGPETWHWIAKDISPFQGEVGQGTDTIEIADGAIRTKEAADTYAVSKFGAIKDHSTWGRLKILGNPKVKLADAVEIKNAPKPELNGLFKVTSVRHVLNKKEGYLTYIGFSGLGGAD